MSEAQVDSRPDGFRRVCAHLGARGHPHAPRFLEGAARTAQEAADALGVGVGQIAKSVVFRRKADAAAVIVVTSGDRRVDENKVAALVGAVGRADAEFVKARTGFTIGGVSPVAHAPMDAAASADAGASASASASAFAGAGAPLLLIDRELFRFDVIWAAAGHPNGVFRASPDELVRLTGAPVADVVVA
jgi:prolyl-tRNA editing enzyme YbaK/EbsC (Cys-tRNA(Pro) deacylase)